LQELIPHPHNCKSL